MARLAAAIIDEIVHCGAEFLSAYPTTPLIDAAALRELRPVLCRQERTGVHIADGFTRVRDGITPGVFAMQWGPGVENAYPGIATAFADSVPMLLLPLGYGDDLDRSARFTSIEHLRPVTKSIERLTDPVNLADVMRRAAHQRLQGRPGPVAVEIPMDIALSSVEHDPTHSRPVRRVRSAGDPSDIGAAAGRLSRAERPLILAGQGVLYSQATQALLELAELVDAPVATTLLGKSAFPEHHPLSVGTVSSVMPGPARDALEEADLVVAVGTSLRRHPMSIPPPQHTALVHITVDPDDIGRDCEPDIAIVGDAELVLRQLLDDLAERYAHHPSPERGTSKLIAHRRAAWLAAWQPLLSSDESPINPYRVVAELTATLEADTSIVTHDSGSPRDQLTPFYRATTPRSYLGWGKSHALGTGLGLIMGAKLAAPERTCVNVMGDAAFGMVGLDFETAVRNQIPIITIVLNNATMAIETRTLRISHERYRTRDIGGNYAELARAMGGWAVTVDHPAAIAPGLRDAVAANHDGTPALIEIITSPNETPFSHRAGLRDTDLAATH